MCVILDTCNNNTRMRVAILISVNSCHAATGGLKTISKLHAAVLNQSMTGLPGGILGYQIDPNLVSKLLVWYQLFLFGILQKFGIRCKQIWYPTRDLVSSVNSNFLLKKLIF